MKGSRSKSGIFILAAIRFARSGFKDRRGRTLSYEDLEQAHNGKSVRRGYQSAKVVTALPETIRLMAAIDAALRLPLRVVSESPAGPWSKSRCADGSAPARRR